MNIKNLIILVLVSFCLSFSSRQTQWVAIGDSITYLNDHPDETGFRVKKGYLTRVVEELPDITYINKGYNGWTSGGIAEKITELKIPKADIYSIFLGTNDWWAKRPAGTEDDYIKNTGNQTVYGSFRIIIDHLRNLNSKAKIILITPLQRGDFVYFKNFDNNAFGSYRKKDGRELVEIVNAIKKIGEKENFTVIDLYNESGITQENMVKYKRLKDPATGDYKNFPYPDFTDIPFDTKNDPYPYPEDAIDMTYDGLHPSDKGNAVIASMLIEIIRKL